MSSLIKLAASFARGDAFPSCCPEDLPKSTPKRVVRLLMDLHDRAKGWAIQIREAHDEIERLRRTIHAQDDARVIELQNWLGWQCRNQGATKALVEGRAAVVPLPIMNSTMAGVAFTKYLSVKKMKGEGHRAHVSRAVHVAVTGMIDECRLDKPMENN